jgi:hypothetical protein
MSDGDTEDELRRSEKIEIGRPSGSRDTERDKENARRRERYAADPDYRAKVLARNRSKARERWLKGEYGLSLEEYDRMLARQGGLCALCARKPKQRLVVDHCHDTRKLRRLLCRRCNAGLGHYDDSPVLLRLAADYIELWRALHAGCC